MSDCGQRGWVDEDQEFDNACECLRESGHDGLHECGSGCGELWAGGMTKEAFNDRTE